MMMYFFSCLFIRDYEKSRTNCCVTFKSEWVVNPWLKKYYVCSTTQLMKGGIK